MTRVISLAIVLLGFAALTVGCSERQEKLEQPSIEATETELEMESEDYEKAMSEMQ